MKTLFISLIILFSVGNLSAQFGNTPPFTIEIEAIPNTNTIGLHSFAFAQWGSKWLFVGGRTNGLHGFLPGTGFPMQAANNQLIVIDTVNWQTWTSSLNSLPVNLAEPLRSANMQYYQNGNYLYAIGGYGFDSTQLKNVTFPTLTAIRIDSTINAVIQQKQINSFIRQIKDNRLQICGGELEKLDSTFYLFFGHDYNGDYPDTTAKQVYSNQIKKFSIADDGINLSIDNYTTITDSVEFHRRDLTVAPFINPNGKPGLAAYSGVFTPNFKPFTHPIYVDAGGVQIDTTYNQVLNLYTCARIPLFDSLTQNMHTIFMGGVSNRVYDEVSEKLITDNKIPFTNDITVLTKYADGHHEEKLLPIQLPGLIGKNAKFILNEHLPHYDNQVIHLNGLTERTLLGYFFGGIRAERPNQTLSIANDTIYRIFINPTKPNGVNKTYATSQQLRTFPNPCKEHININFSLLKTEQVALKIRDIFGNTIKTITTESLAPGEHIFTVEVSEFAPQPYVCQLQTESFIAITRFAVIK